MPTNKDRYNIAVDITLTVHWLEPPNDDTERIRRNRFQEELALRGFKEEQILQDKLGAEITNDDLPF